MMDLDFLVSNFEQEYAEKKIDNRDELRKKFVSEFPLESIKEIDLEQYALGKKTR